MRLSRPLLVAVAVAATVLPTAACANYPIGNTNNHISTGPPLPEVHPPTVTPTPTPTATN